MFMAGMVAFVISAAVFHQQSRDSAPLAGSSLTPAALAEYYHLPRTGTVELSGSEPQFGRSDAPYLIVEWADYGCPWCAKAGAGVKDLVSDNADIQLRFKHYPLSNQCNAHVAGDMHPTACECSKATECARQQGRFWELNDLLFKNQSYQSAEDVRFMAKQIGLDMEALEACMADPITEQRLRTDTDHANTVDITGTPTFFIKGLFGEQWVQVRSKPEVMKAIIDAHAAGESLPEPGPAPARDQ
jgi:protein-disulfide isomerase